jgi:hypothetical protein
MIKSILLEEIENKEGLKRISIKALRHLFPNKYLPVRPYNKQKKQEVNNGGTIRSEDK